jgi:hypothetical protein
MYRLYRAAANSRAPDACPDVSLNRVSTVAETGWVSGTGPDQKIALARVWRIREEGISGEPAAGFWTVAFTRGAYPMDANGRYPTTGGVSRDSLNKEQKFILPPFVHHPLPSSLP